MESAFYDEANNASLSQHDKVGTAYKNLKRSMTLNLNEPSNKKLKPHLRAKACDILTSPDVGLLKLASPELERLIIQSCNSLISSSPSPAQFLCPKSGTDEQEGFADGFVKALAELHHQQQQMPHLNATLAPGHHAQQACGESGGATYQCRPSAECPNPNPSPNPCALLTRGSSAYANVDANANANANVSSCMVANAVPLQTSRSAEIPCFLPHLLKEEPQRVPEVRRETPPLSPIDMDNQERIKAERKRMRNRVAASKCRKRKLERLSRLEEKVKSLKSLNGELCAAANSLRDEVAKLKQKVMDHVNSGCHLILAQQTQTLRGALG